MRGDAERQTNMLLAVTPDSFIPDDHPIRRIKPIVDAALRRLSPLFDTMYSTGGAALDPARASAQGEPADRALLDPQRAPVLRAAALRPAVQVVPGPQHLRRALQRHHVLQEPRAPARGQRRTRFLRRGGGRGEAAQAALGRALHRRRDAARGVGVTEELPARATTRTRRPGAGATRRSISGGSSGAATPTPAARTPKRGSTARGGGRKRRSATWVTC